jgi:hypothetical protein
MPPARTLPMTTTLTLACGPYFAEDGLLISLIIFLVIKPLAYFAFIQAFRYRVSRPIPMRFRQAVALTLARAGLGVGLSALGAGVLWLSRSETLWSLSWVYLYAERLFSWWVVGRYGARVRGRRLVGWVISGTLINAAFDAAMVMGLLAGAWPPAAVIAGIIVFIALLHLIGRRESLRLRFADASTCHGCGYALTGNLSGVCPECGRATTAAA